MTDSPSPSAELPKQYDPAASEGPTFRRWLLADAFAAVPGSRGAEAAPYVIMMPLPNVTGALHMGHAMDNVMQDLLVRWHRMQGDDTLWMAGTDHAGIATQSVVETRLYDLEGKTRHDLGREKLVERIWAWKAEYQARIVRQQQAMGCSCDWQRQRFTMDAVCSAAVRENFFRLFRDQLIYRGHRLVNWDCKIQTAVADDELYPESVQGTFTYMRYPLLDARPGEPTHVTVATTRPETMLGDTAVAVHPDPARALEQRIEEQREKLAAAPQKERAAEQAELERLEGRKTSHLPGLVQLAAMAARGCRVRLPLLGREIPLIADEWAKPDLGSGCVKITPAHDPNDYQVWTRHRERIGILNVLAPDGSLNAEAGPYAGLDRYEARKRVVQDLEAQGLIEAIEERTLELQHSDRSKTVVEPYLSLQWFVRMGDVPGGIVCGRGTAKEHRAPGLAQAAIDAARPDWRSPTGRNVSFHPDPERYRGMYLAWLAEKRDWCISRQLWWGHRIPVWHAANQSESALRAAIAALPRAAEDLQAWLSDAEGALHPLPAPDDPLPGGASLLVCLRSAEADVKYGPALAALQLTQDPDVLDTWFSSALWPFSTLGWPDPARAQQAQEPGQRDLAGCLERYYPGSCLVTGRDIITLWVARMVMMGLYDLGDVPFTDVFLHAKILDGKGEGMSKHKGNGVDPVDIIERYGTDAMRYVICDLQTGMQDVRLPVQAECPHCRREVELAEARHGRTRFTWLCTHCCGEFDVLKSQPPIEGAPWATAYSTRFLVGRNFCNKLWNSARFALMKLEQLPFAPLQRSALAEEDRWILSRLQRAITGVDEQLRRYAPSAAQAVARDFMWNELCDWYLELIKPRLSSSGASPGAARQVLAHVLDQTLRLLHPFVPFVTETIWERLHAQAPARGIDRPLPASELLCLAAWPEPRAEWVDEGLEADFAQAFELVGKLRDLRAQYNVPPGKKLPGGLQAGGEAGARLARLAALIQHMAGLETLQVGAQLERPRTAAVAVVGEVEVWVADVFDPEKERGRLEKELEKLRGQTGGIEKKLGNPGFLAKAKPEVVEGERKRLGELQQQIQSVEQSLAALG